MHERRDTTKHKLFIAAYSHRAQSDTVVLSSQHQTFTCISLPLCSYADLECSQTPAVERTIFGKQSEPASTYRSRDKETPDSADKLQILSRVYVPDLCMSPAALKAVSLELSPAQLYRSRYPLNRVPSKLPKSRYIIYLETWKSNCASIDIKTVCSTQN